MRKTIIFFGTILLFSVIVLGGLNSAIFDTKFYEKEFSKTKVYEKFGKEVADEKRDVILTYFDNAEEKLTDNFFNEKEISHMVDVKNLIVLSQRIFYVCLAILLLLFAYILFTKNDSFHIISRIFQVASSTIFLIILFAAILQADFSQLFVSFHEILFSNNLWLLDPATDNLINLFPEQFFFDILLQITVKIVLASSCIFVVSFVLKFKDI